MILKKVDWDVSQKVKSKERNEIKRRVWTLVTHGDVR
jgi:hypothetical protein